MSDPSFELYAAIINRLLADSAVQAMVGSRVYYTVPKTPTYLVLPGL